MTTKIVHALRLTFSCNGLRTLMAAVSLITLLALGVAVQAQSAYTTFYKSAVVYGGAVNTPGGVAADSSGNVYIADYAGNQVLKETLQSNGTYVQTSIGTGLNSPYGVAVDASGNLYISDTGNRRIVKETLSGGVYTQTVVSALGLTQPTGIAVDPAGNVYVCDPQSVKVFEEALQSGGTYFQAVIADVSAGLVQPTGVAVDSSLNVFIADVGVVGIIELPFASLGANNVSNYGAQATIGTNVFAPKGVGVDGHNNVYIADTGKQEIIEETLQSSGGYVQSIVANNLPTVGAVAVDARGNVYAGVTAPSPEVLKFSVFDGNFGLVNVGTTSPKLTLTFNFQAGGPLTSIAVVTGGTTGLDFAYAGTGTCTTGHTYNTGDNCTVDVTLTPLYSGVRYGAVELFNGSTLFATGYIYGTGVGPQLVYLPGVINTIATNYPNLTGIAVDGSENVYLSGWEYDTVFKIAAPTYNTITEIGGGFNSLSGVASDGAGNVYVSDYYVNKVYKLIAGDNFTSTVQMAQGLSNPSDIAVDGDGNVYISNYTNSQVNEILASSNYTVAINIATNFTSPSGIGVDGGGDVFLDNFNNGKIYEIQAVNGAIPYAPTPIQIAVGFPFWSPQGLKLDDNGNVYVSDQNNSRVVEILAATGFTTTYILPYSLPRATDVAIDAQGNIYVPNNGDNAVVRIDIGDAPSLTFEATPVGSTSPDSPQTVTLENIGNVPLTFPIPTSGNNPSISSDFNLGTGSSACPITGSGSSSAGILGVNAMCNLAISFTPIVTGNIMGQVILTDNVLYAQAPTYATQVINLNGTGGGNTMTVTAGSYTIATNQATPTWGYTAYGVLGTSICTGKASISVYVYGTSTLYSPQNGPYAIGVYTLGISPGNFLCESQYTKPYTFVNGTLTVTRPVANLYVTTTNAGPIAQGSPIPNLSNNYTLIGFVNGDTQAVACQGTVPQISTLATSASPAGQYQVTANGGTFSCGNGSANYTIIIQNSGKLTITSPTTISWTPVPASISYGTALGSGELDAIAYNGSSNISANGVFKYYLNAIGGTVATVGTVPPTSTTQLCVTWTPSAGFNGTYSPASACVPFTVGMVTPTISWSPNPTTITYGTKLVSGQLNAVANNGATNISSSGTFVYYVGPVGGTVANTNTVLPAGTDQLCVQWTPNSANSANYNSASACTNITVNQATTTITWVPNPATINYGTGLVAGELNAAVFNGATNVSASGTFAYTQNTYTGPAAAVGTILPAGTDTLCVQWTPSSGNSGNLSSAQMCVTITVNAVTPTLTWSPSPGTITYGTGLVSGQLNAVAKNGATVVSADGAFAYYLGSVAPGNLVTVGSVLPAGNPDSLCVVWTPTSPTWSGDFNPATLCNVHIIVNKAAALVFKATSSSIVYGSPDPSLSPAVSGTNFTVTGLVNGDTFATACTGSPVLNYTPATPANVGSYPITIAAGSVVCANYATPTYSAGTLTITKATGTLTLTSTNGTSVYGTTPNVAGNFTLTGFVGADTQASACTGSPSITTTATATSPVGTYPITAANGTLVCSSANATYTLTDVSTGQLTITKATGSLTLTSTNGTSVYGTTPNVAGDYTLTGFVTGDTQASACTGSPSITTTATATSPVGTYPITAANGTLVCSSANATYTLTDVSTGQLTITKATGSLTLTSTNGTSPYGVTPNVSGDYSLTGFVGGDSQATACTGAPTVTTTATATSLVSPPTYPITASATGLSCSTANANYSIVLGSNSGQLTITKSTATLTLTSTNGTSVYGTTPNVAGDYSLTGFINGDTQASACTGTPSVTTTATAASPAGIYPITAALNGLTCSSPTTTYTIVLGGNNGKLTISQAALTLTATPYALAVYGQPIPASFSYTVSGFVNGDTQASACSGAATTTPTATQGSPVGLYVINIYQGTLVCPNYSYIFNTGELKVGPAVLTVTPNPVTLTYSSPVPTYGYTLSGFYGSDTAATSLTGVPTITTTAVTRATSTRGLVLVTSPIGNYTLNAHGGSLQSHNYKFAFATSTMTITPATTPLTITARNVTVPNSSSIPSTFAYTMTGMLGFDNAATAGTGSPNLTTTANSSSPAGNYPINTAPGTFSAPNYSGVNYVNGVLTIK